MAAIEDLIDQVEDKALKNRLIQELSRLNKQKKFGLVFEEHLPEYTPIYNANIKKGSTVARKGQITADTYIVLSIEKDIVYCLNKVKQEKIQIPIDELVVIAQFGDSIFPSLTPVDKVKNGRDDSLWHILIEADNYHALQLLEYLYPKKVDCIYIDPPYNTGARDWKYNNNYVDKNDSWRHSKWLSFMEKRLKLAKRLLNPIDSVLILAIDDNELYTVGLLLDEIFSGSEKQIINIKINPKGKARDGRLSQVDEYLIVIYLGAARAQELIVENSAEEIRWPYLRRSDVESARGTKKGGVRQFYPIYVDIKTEKIVHIGEYLTPEEPLDSIPEIEGAIPVFPIREDGKQMNWGLTGPSLKELADNGYVRVMKSSNINQQFNFSYVTLPSVEKVKDGIYQVEGLRADGTKIVVIPHGKSRQGTTVWSKNLYDANAYGSQIVGALLPNKKFPFPKSLYAVSDVLKTYIGNNPNALVLDFFAGSGTTLHAVNLLNAEDNGKRRCIIVTNNEVSEAESKKLLAQGHLMGSNEWEMNGICQSVTWPRTKYSILGSNEDGDPLTGEYHTNLTQEVIKSRTFNQLSFSSKDMLNTTAKKKQLVAMLGKDKLPQSLVKANNNYIISKTHDHSILFDEMYLEDWLLELNENAHIKYFYIVTANNALFEKAKKQISELLGDIVLRENITLPMKNGFEANAEYFKLSFLDKNSVELGQQFREILPLLWLQSGMVGERPELPSDIELPAFYNSNRHNFAVLIDETYFAEFVTLISQRENLSHVYLVTNSDEAFREMASKIQNQNVYQLYRDYIDNFVINSRRL